MICQREVGAMSRLTRRRVRILVAAAIALVYVLAALTEALQTDDQLLHVLVLAAGTTLFGDAVLDHWRP